MRWGFSPQQCQSTQHFMGSVPRGALRSPAFFFFFFWFWIMIHLSAATATSSPAATAPVEHGERHKDLRGVRPSKCHRGRCSARIMCLWTFLSAAMLPVMYCAALLSFSWGPGAVFRQEMCISKRKKKNREWTLNCEDTSAKRGRSYVRYLLLKKQPFSFRQCAFLFILNLLKRLRWGWGTPQCFPPANCHICFSSWSALPHFLSSGGFNTAARSVENDNNNNNKKSAVKSTSAPLAQSFCARWFCPSTYYLPPATEYEPHLHKSLPHMRTRCRTHLNPNAEAVKKQNLEIEEAHGRDSHTRHLAWQLTKETFIKVTAVTFWQIHI